MPTYSTIATPAEIATELGLTGLFILGTDADTSRYNHADGTSGTITGTPTYSSNSATFGSGVFIDTGVPETTELTMLVAWPQTDTFRFGCASFNNENELLTGMYINNFGRQLTWQVAGNQVSFTNERASVPSGTNEASKEAGKPICGIGSWKTGGPAKLWEPRRYLNVTANITGSGARVVYGSNYLIGNGPGSSKPGGTPASTAIHMVAIADYEMTDAQNADLFVWASKHLQTRGVYL